MSVSTQLLALVGLLLLAKPLAAQETLESQIKRQPVSAIAKRARVLGDPASGALILYRQGLACVQCHTAGEGPKLLGPDLSQMQDRSTAEHVIESILDPSKTMQKGFETSTLLLTSGLVVSGIVRKESENELVVAVAGEDQPRAISAEDIDERIPGNSLMPAGLVNQLADEQEFYDLVSFLVKLGEGGPERASMLKPAESLIAPPPLPDYEKDLDHAGLIASWDKLSLERGKTLYNALCINCHGTIDEPGSLPNALRFASGTFRNGNDPLSIYNTITHGYRMMLPQRQLVPQQKYDVIHYIRETYLNKHNPSQYKGVDDEYLAALPKGTKRGPAPVKHEPWRDMDYGPFLISSYEMVGPETGPRLGVTAEEQRRADKEHRPPNEQWPQDTNFAYKGIAIRLDPGEGGVSAGSHWIVFDHDTLRVAGAWSGNGFIDWEGILFNGRHAVTPRTVGQQHFANPAGPGWANPETGSFDDPRLRGHDARPYGPLPRQWAHYRGLYKYGSRVIVAYTVGDAAILETHAVVQIANPSGETAANPLSNQVSPGQPTAEPSMPVWVRTLNVGQSSRDLLMRVAPAKDVAVAVNGSDVVSLSEADGYTVLKIPATATPVNFDLLISQADAEKRIPRAVQRSVPESLEPLTKGGPAQWSRPLVTLPVIGNDDGPFAIDVLTRPRHNAWKSRLRMSGLDFFPDGKRLVACCCDGDVWIVDGIDFDETGHAGISESSIQAADGSLGESAPIRWRRIASGLFHPLGIKIVNGRIFVSCRDQIVILNDVNGDGETDFYENFNNDHQVTDHFHEFAMGLQVDAAGNLYYAKSARHARDSLVPQHGTLLRVSPDGGETEIVANGFRAANGVCLNPDGSFFVTDQEGHWTPMNRINRVVEGGFYGNMYSYGAPTDSGDQAMEMPICWVDKTIDRSPAELLWVNSQRWGPLNGSLLNLSYGYGKVFIVPHEKVGDHWQGGMCRLPLPQFPTGVMRARFHPGNGQMYACGMYAWASNQDLSDGGLYRVRYTGKPAHVPIALSARHDGMRITFSDALDPQSATNPENYLIEIWSLKRTASYGSNRYGQRTLKVATVELSDDGRTILLALPDIQPTWCMQIAYHLKDAGGVDFNGVIQNTIHELSESPHSQP